MSGQFTDAIGAGQMSVDLLRRAGRVRETALSLVSLGDLLREAGEPAAAVEAFAEALSSLGTMGDRSKSSYCRQQIDELSMSLS